MLAAAMMGFSQDEFRKKTEEVYGSLFLFHDFFIDISDQYLHFIIPQVYIPCIMSFILDGSRAI